MAKTIGACLYLPVISSLRDVCEQAFDLLRAGDLVGARHHLDKARILRSRISKRVDELRSLTIEEWADDLENDNDHATAFTEVAAAVNETSEAIFNWLSNVINQISEKELLLTREGCSLFLDAKLPMIWDFQNDIVVLDDAHQEIITEVLLERGQRKIIRIRRDNHSIENESLNVKSVLHTVVDLNPDEKIQTEQLAVFQDRDLPALTFIGQSSSEESRIVYDEVIRKLQAVLLGQMSVRAWPRIFCQQLIANLPSLMGKQSIDVLKRVMSGRSALLASPGPSLMDSLEAIKEFRDCFVLFCPIRSLKVLFEAGIEPDYAVHVDATDFSEFIPNNHKLRRITLITTDYTHRSILEAPFSDFIIAPDPALIGNELSKALHGDSPPELNGGGVATCTVALLAQLEISSITLVGQDLSLSRGTYAGGGSLGGHAKGEEITYLPCKAIGGGEVETKSDYLWFIGEMTNIAAHFDGKLKFFNSTAAGAFLENWEHLPLNNQHPAVKGSRHEVNRSEKDQSSDIISKGPITPSEVTFAIESEVQKLQKVAQHCIELVVEIDLILKEDRVDVRKLEHIEDRLNEIVNEKGSIVRFYSSSARMAFAASLKSVTSLDENLTVSAQYYSALGANARRLADLLNNAVRQLGL